jgi:hypothetical protein
MSRLIGRPYTVLKTLSMGLVMARYECGRNDWKEKSWKGRRRGEEAVLYSSRLECQKSE